MEKMIFLKEGDINMANVPNNKSVEQPDKSTKAYSNMMLYLRELKLHNEKSSEMVEKLYEESKSTNKKFDQIQDKQAKSDEYRDNDVRVLKREMTVLNSSLEENLNNRIAELETQLAKTKRSLTIYMRIILWVMLAILFVNILQFIPIEQLF